MRSGTHVGLTTRLSAVSTTRGIRLLAIDPPVSFPLALLRGGPPGAAASLLASLAIRGSAPEAPTCRTSRGASPFPSNLFEQCGVDWVRVR